MSLTRKKMMLGLAPAGRISRVGPGWRANKRRARNASERFMRCFPYNCPGRGRPIGNRSRCQMAEQLAAWKAVGASRRDDFCAAPRAGRADKMRLSAETSAVFSLHLLIFRPPICRMPFWPKWCQAAKPASAAGERRGVSQTCSPASSVRGDPRAGLVWKPLHIAHVRARSCRSSASGDCSFSRELRWFWWSEAAQPLPRSGPLAEGRQRLRERVKAETGHVSRTFLHFHTLPTSTIFWRRPGPARPEVRGAARNQRRFLETFCSFLRTNLCDAVLAEVVSAFIWRASRRKPDVLSGKWSAGDCPPLPGAGFTLSTSGLRLDARRREFCGVVRCA